MGIKNSCELLCIQGRGRNYAYEFPVVKEICPGLQISKIPCLPKFFIGVCNYKGGMVPVLSMDESWEAGEKSLIFIFEHQGYQLGVLYPGEPYILDAGSYTEIQKPELDHEEGIWTEKMLIQANGEVYAVMDMQKIILNLAKYFQEVYLR